MKRCYSENPQILSIMIQTAFNFTRDTYAISWTIAERLGQILGTKLDTTATIDSQFVKIPESHVKEFLLQIDNLGMKAARLYSFLEK